MRMRILLISVLMLSVCTPMLYAETFMVGYAERDITPQKPVPMWGYGARHAMLSTGARDVLRAQGVVVAVGSEKLAIVGMDIGRGPTEDMLQSIKKAIAERSGVKYVLISGSHSHHGPVIELKDEPGKGKGKFEDAIAYTRDLEKNLIELICEAAGNVKEATVGWASEDVPWNRNRHSKREPKAVDPEFGVVRFDDSEGKPIAMLVNFAAHPVNLSIFDARLSSEFPGELKRHVEAKTGIHCMYMPGAGGDMSCNKGDADSIEEFGAMLGDKAIELSNKIAPTAPAVPSLKVVEDDWIVPARMDLQHPYARGMFQLAFFPELVAALDEMPNNQVHPRMTTVVLNGALALVGGSGEFYCNHSVRLKQRSYNVKTLFFGYCNGHHMYFPTIEGVSEGGYGADAMVSWVPVGMGEQMMDKALINIYTALGKYKDPKVADIAAGKIRP